MAGRGVPGPLILGGPTPYSAGMGRLNFLVEGVSGTGKTSVCHELRRRGLHALNGDTDLAYQGDPITGEEHDGQPSHEKHIWRVAAVRQAAADAGQPMTFFCRGSRNFSQFLDVFDEVFVLQIDADTLQRRLAQRPDDEFGSSPTEREFILRLHADGADVPKHATQIDATQPLDRVVDQLLARATAHRA